MDQSKERDKLIEQGRQFCHYIKPEEKVIGVYNTPEDMKRANNSKVIKSLVNKHNFTIQIIIK